MLSLACAIDFQGGHGRPGREEIKKILGALERAPGEMIQQRLIQ
jgi:hypothetical protein